MFTGMHTTRANREPDICLLAVVQTPPLGTTSALRCSVLWNVSKSPNAYTGPDVRVCVPGQDERRRERPTELRKTTEKQLEYLLNPCLVSKLLFRQLQQAHYLRSLPVKISQGKGVDSNELDAELQACLTRLKKHMAALTGAANVSLLGS